AKALSDLPDAATMRPLLEVMLASVLLQETHYDAALAALDRAEGMLLPGEDLHVTARGDLEGVRGDIWLALGMPDTAYGCLETCARVAEEQVRNTTEPDFTHLVQARLRQAALAIALRDWARVGDLLDAEIERRARDLHDGTLAQLLVR